MNLLAVEKICGYLLLGALSISVPSASGQYYNGPAPNANQNGNNKMPLNQLPPIISSEQANQNSSMLQPVKGLYIPSDAGNLPPIVSPITSKAPFVYQQTSPKRSNDLPTGKQQNSGSQNGRSFPPLSNGGVPIYQGQPPVTRNNPNNFGQSSFQGSESRSVPAIQDSGSGSRSLPPVLSSDPSNPSSLPIQDFSDSLSPGDLPVLPDVELNTPDSVVELNSGTGVPIPLGAPISSGIPIESNIPGTNNFFSQPVPAPTNSGVNSGCPTCGPGGCYDPAHVQQQNGCSGSVSSAGNYMFLDFLGWTRAGNDGDVQLSQFAGLNDFGYSGGVRFTLGHRQNTVSGRELTYMGTGRIGESILTTSTTNGLNPTFTAGGGFNFGDISGFFNANTHFQRKSTLIQSLSYDRVKWGWDVVKTMIGVRYIYFQDDYYFFSSNGMQNGLFTMNSVNNFFGLNGGFELFYDVGYRTSVSITNKWGAYINSANIDTNLFNFGIQELSQDTDDSTIASTIEIGLMGHLQLSPRARLRAGWDILLMWGAFTTENNIPRDTFANGFQTGTPVLTPNTGADLNTNNQPVFLSGLSFGFEVFR